MTKCLKSNGFLYIMNYPLMIIKSSFHKQFLRRLQDNYLHELRYANSSKVNTCMELLYVGCGYEFQECLEKNKKS